MSVCDYPPCERDASCNGLCKGHYMQRWRGQELHGLSTRGPIQRRTHPTCSFEGCGRPNGGGGLCDGHRRQQARGTPLRKLGIPRGRPTRAREGVNHATADA